MAKKHPFTLLQRARVAAHACWAQLPPVHHLRRYGSVLIMAGAVTSTLLSAGGGGHAQQSWDHMNRDERYYVKPFKAEDGYRSR
jgi:hypothetical protein